MITAALLCSSILAGSADTASDYFPLRPGDEYTYSDESGYEKWTILDRVGGPVTVGEKEAFKIDSYLGGKTFGATYYFVEPKEIFVAAYKPDKPLSQPLPIFRIPEAGANWAFSGQTVMIEGEVNMSLIGEVKKVKQVKFLGENRDALEVKLKVDDGTIQTEQVSTYLKGIGLYLMKETVKINKSKKERVRRLISYKPAKPQVQ